MRLTEFLGRDRVEPDLEAATRSDALAALASLLAGAEPGVDRDRLLASLLERERLGSTAVGDGLAIPHARMKGLDRVTAVFARSRRGIDFEAADGEPCRLFVLLVAPEWAAADHLRALSRVARVMRDAATRRRLLDAPDASALYALLAEADDGLRVV